MDKAKIPKKNIRNIILFIGIFLMLMLGIMIISLNKEHIFVWMVGEYNPYKKFDYFFMKRLKKVPLERVINATKADLDIRWTGNLELFKSPSLKMLIDIMDQSNRKEGSMIVIRFNTANDGPIFNKYLNDPDVRIRKVAVLFKRILFPYYDPSISRESKYDSFFNALESEFSEIRGEAVEEMYFKYDSDNKIDKKCREKLLQHLDDSHPGVRKIALQVLKRNSRNTFKKFNTLGLQKILFIKLQDSNKYVRLEALRTLTSKSNYSNFYEKVKAVVEKEPDSDIQRKMKQELTDWDVYKRPVLDIEVPGPDVNKIK